MFEITPYIAGHPKVLLPDLYRNPHFNNNVQFSFSRRRDPLPIAKTFSGTEEIPLMHLLLTRAFCSKATNQYPPEIPTLGKHLKIYHPPKGVIDPFADLGLFTCTPSQIVITDDPLFKMKLNPITHEQSRTDTAFALRAIVNTFIGGRQIIIRANGKPIDFTRIY